MTLDTLAYAKHLEQAGIDRRHAEAHAEAMNRHLLPELATKADLTVSLTDLRHDLTTTIHQAEWRIAGIVFAMLGLLFALIKLT